MKANNLSICVPYKGCDKNCPYCVSKMTRYNVCSDIRYMARNYRKVKNFAKMANVTSVSITGKGEPCLNMKDTLELIREFCEFPVELQTNGLKLLREPALISAMQLEGLDVLSLSFDKLSDFDKFSTLFLIAHNHGLTTRVTYNITRMTPKDTSFLDFMTLCEKYGIDQFSFRQVTVPKEIKILTEEAKKAKKWIEENVYTPQYLLLKDQIKGNLLRELPYGAALFDYEGISVTAFDYCIQEKSDSNDIRSLIFQEDGHVYSTWNSKASRIF